VIPPDVAGPVVPFVADVGGPVVPFVAEVAGPVVPFVEVAAVSEVSQPEAAFVAEVAAVAEPQASVDIVFAFDVLVPLSVVAVEVDSSGRPKFFAFPNVDHHASDSSSVEVVGEEFVHSSTGAHTNYGLCSIPSNLGLHQNRNLGQIHNNPNPGHNKGSDTNDLPIDATTNHSRKTGLHHLYQEKRTHRPCQASLSHLVARQIRWAVVEKYSR
jgi:hypothetical protein